MSPWVFHLLLASLGLALAALAAGALLRLWRRRPVAAYRLLVLVLVAALLLPGAQFLVEGWRLPKRLPWAEHLASLRHPATTATGVPLPVPAPVPAPAPEGRVPLPVPDSTPAPLLDPAPPLDPLPLNALLTPEEPTPAQAPPLPALPLFATLYLLGLGLALVRTTARLLRARRLLHAADPVRDPLVLAVWRELATASPIGARVALLTTPEIDVPMCFGLRRPAILLPAAEDPALDPSVLRCVLLHELVHLERRDTWIMLAQEGLCTLFWFHPAAWWLCRKIDALRELSCDLLVVARTGRRKRYASALVEYAAWLRRGPAVPAPSTALLSWTSTKSQLARRIEMLVDLTPQRSRSRRATLVAAVAFFGSLWSGQLALAAAATPAQEPAPRPAPAPLPELPPLPRIDVTVPEIALEPPPGLALVPPAAVPRLAAPPAPIGTGGPGGPGGVLGLRAPLPLAQDGAPMIGVRISEADEDTARELDRPADEMIVVESVIANTLAERAGIRGGDVIVRIDGRPATFENLRESKRRLVREAIVLEIVRGDRTIDVEVGPSESRSRGWTGETRPDRPDGTADALARARAALERALREHPEDENLASALEALRQAQAERHEERAQARHAYDRALREYRGPDADEMREARRRWEKQMHEHAEEARKHVEKARKDAEHVRKEALKHAEQARKEALKHAEKARKEAEKHAEHARKEAEKVRKEALKHAEKARQEAERHQRHEESRRRVERDDGAGDVESRLDELRDELRRRQKELEELRRKLEQLDRERARDRGDGRSAAASDATRPVGVSGRAR